VVVFGGFAEPRVQMPLRSARCSHSWLRGGTGGTGGIVAAVRRAHRASIPRLMLIRSSRDAPGRRGHGHWG